MSDLDPNPEVAQRVLELIGRKRILALWLERRYAAPDFTDEERDLIGTVWRTIPNGGSCLMTAFFHLYNLALKGTKNGV